MEIDENKLRRAEKLGFNRRDVELLLAYYGDNYDSFYDEPADCDLDKAIDCLVYEHEGEDDPTPEELVREAVMDGYTRKRLPYDLQEYLSKTPEKRWDWNSIIDAVKSFYTVKGKFILIPW